MPLLISLYLVYEGLKSMDKTIALNNNGDRNPQEEIILERGVRNRQEEKIVVGKGDKNPQNEIALDNNGGRNPQETIVVGKGDKNPQDEIALDNNGDKNPQEKIIAGRGGRNPKEEIVVKRGGKKKTIVVEKSRGEGGKEIYTVEKIYDGDTILVVNQRGRESKVRFACVDSPEKSQRLGEAATNHLQWLIKQSDNKVMLDITSKDGYDRKVAVVYLLNNYPVQLMQIREGKVFGYGKYKKNCPIWNQIESMEAIAKSKKIGVWGDKTPEYPWEYR